MKGYNGIIERYRERLPIAAGTRIVSLCEGDTPLLRLHHIPALLGKDIALYVKYEGLNPTGSFKDRGMTMAVTKAVEEGSRAILCASTGNTSASAAAYAARAGIRAFVLIPEGKIALGKLAQAVLHGALVMQIQGNFDVGMRLVKDVAVRLPVTLVNSVNPYRLEGQKTAAFEVIEALGRRTRLPLPAGRKRRQHHGLLDGLPGIPRARPGGRPPRACAVIKRAAPHPSCAATRSTTRKPWRPRSGSATRSPGTWPCRRKPSPAVGSTSCPTPRSSRPKGFLRSRKGSSASPPPRPRSPARCGTCNAARSPRAASSSAPCTGHGLKDPDIAIAQSVGPALEGRGTPGGGGTGDRGRRSESIGKARQSLVIAEFLISPVRWDADFKRRRQS